MTRSPQPLSFADIARQLGGADQPARTTTTPQVDRIFEVAREIDRRRNPQSTFTYDYDALAY